ncbi:MAG: hypothetical protein Q8R88_00555 [Desulfoprunum sp.]|nr:hypothetical protein [Desulfoprunum sp.]
MAHQKRTSRYTLHTVFTLLQVFSIALGVCWGADSSDLAGSEQIGRIRQGMSQSAVFSLLGPQPERGPSELWGADGMYHQIWKYRGAGIELSMVGEKKDSVKAVESITVTAPCPLSTKRGIHIGSTENEVMVAYRAEFDKDASMAGESFVAGSVFGGLVFHFQANKVDQIFLGASAE